MANDGEGKVIANGSTCEVIAGTVSITVRLPDDDRIKTLAKNVRAT